MYIAQETADRISYIAKSKNISVGKMLEECQLNKNTLSSMRSRGSWIQTNNIAKIADYLGVSVDYLIGRSNESDIDKQFAGVDFAIYSETKNLNEEQKKDVLKFVQFLKNKDED